jgi:hypothetical protein
MYIMCVHIGSLVYLVPLELMMSISQFDKMAEVVLLDEIQNTEWNSLISK